jgi:hypothetical protein
VDFVNEETTMAEIQSSFNFVIKCDNEEELEKIQTKLSYSKQKISAKEFLLKLA